MVARMEVWRDVYGYEGKYRISNNGQVKSLQGAGVKERILKPIKQTTGYLTVNLYNEDGMGQHSIHRLVALHFLERIPGKNIVNHLDGVKVNNVRGNLEWCTVSENNKHAYDAGLSAPPKTSRPGTGHSRFKGHVLAVNLKTGGVIRMAGSAEMKRQGFHDGCVSECLSGKRKTHRGYVFTREKISNA